MNFEDPLSFWQRVLSLLLLVLLVGRFFRRHGIVMPTKIAAPRYLDLGALCRNGGSQG